LVIGLIAQVDVHNKETSELRYIPITDYQYNIKLYQLLKLLMTMWIWGILNTTFLY